MKGCVVSEGEGRRRDGMRVVRSGVRGRDGGRREGEEGGVVSVERGGEMCDHWRERPALLSSSRVVCGRRRRGRRGGSGVLVGDTPPLPPSPAMSIPLTSTSALHSLPFLLSSFLPLHREWWVIGEEEVKEAEVVVEEEIVDE